MDTELGTSRSWVQRSTGSIICGTIGWIRNSVQAALGFNVLLSVLSVVPSVGYGTQYNQVLGSTFYWQYYLWYHRLDTEISTSSSWVQRSTGSIICGTIGWIRNSVQAALGLNVLLSVSSGYYRLDTELSTTRSWVQRSTGSIICGTIGWIRNSVQAALWFNVLLAVLSVVP